MEHAKLEARFHEEMLGIYERAKKEANYNATRFLQLVVERGGLEAARRVLDAPPSDGLGTLFALGRVDLAVEALVQRSEFQPLFTDREIEIAIERVGDRRDS